SLLIVSFASVPWKPPARGLEGSLRAVHHRREVLMKRNPSALVVLAGIALAFACSASAQNIYVRQGAAAGTGACNRPYGTIAEALTAASALGNPVEIRISGGAAP